MIEQARIEAVKHGVDLVELIKSRGVELKKKGKNFVGLCPFHAEETPSFSPSIPPKTSGSASAAE